MKNAIKLFGVIALVAIIGFSMTSCDDSSDDNGGGAKSIKVTGLDELKGSYYELGLATTVQKLENEDVVAYATGIITSSTQTAQLLDPDTDKPWKGSGSYYVGVYTEYGVFVTIKKHSFDSSVTTLSFDDFDYAY
jgi:hypothetical protein